eukprot:gene45457-56621_t
MNFVAFERAKQGTGASRRLRNSGKTPGIVYGGAAEPQLIEIDHNALWHALKKEAFHSSVLDMEVAGKTAKVVLRDVQYHPYKQLVLHIDFQRVDDKTKLHLKVPLHFSGAEESPADKVCGLSRTCCSSAKRSAQASCRLGNVWRTMSFQGSGLGTTLA